MRIAFVEVAGFRGFRSRTRIEFPEGFAVLTGSNGSGKSSVFDAIDFALTGTINKYAVKSAKGGGIEKHTWWVGEDAADEHYVEIGFSGVDGEVLTLRRSRRGGLETALGDVASALCASEAGLEAWQEALIRTTLIRDEVVASLSLDLSEQQRFLAVREALGGVVGPDHAKRTGAILKAAISAKESQARQVERVQSDLGRALGALTEARSAVEDQHDISEAQKILSEFVPEAVGGAKEGAELLRKRLADERHNLFHLTELVGERERLRASLTRLNAGDDEVKFAQLSSLLESANRRRNEASERMETAKRQLAAVQEGYTRGQHLLALLEHGEAVGLEEGHCPLCDSPRSIEEFVEAIARRRDVVRSHVKQPNAAELLLTKAVEELAEAESGYSSVQLRLAEWEEQRSSTNQWANRIGLELSAAGIPAAADEAERELMDRRERLGRLEYALVVVETSIVYDRVRALEVRVEKLRSTLQSEEAALAATERAISLARQIDNGARAVANQVLTEHFDTVLPLLKELYARLRPHADWREIEVDFGGHVRASLNFIVGAGYNPQFLFSSGQRRAAGLAFLLAIHLSRPWCRLETLLLDDPVQHIDDYRALNLVEVLSSIRRTGRQVIVAVEDAALADLLGRRLRSSVEQLGRRIELGSDPTGSAAIMRVVDVPPFPRILEEPSEMAG